MSTLEEILLLSYQSFSLLYDHANSNKLIKMNGTRPRSINVQKDKKLLGAALKSMLNEF